METLFPCTLPKIPYIAYFTRQTPSGVWFHVILKMVKHLMVTVLIVGQVLTCHSWNSTISIPSTCLLVGSDTQPSSLICPFLSPGQYLLAISANSAREESSEEPMPWMNFMDCVAAATSSDISMPSSSTSIVPSATSTSISAGSDSTDGNDSVITFEVSAIFHFLPHFFLWYFWLVEHSFICSWLQELLYSF